MKNQLFFNTHNLVVKNNSTNYTMFREIKPLAKLQMKKLHVKTSKHATIAKFELILNVNIH